MTEANTWATIAGNAEPGRASAAVIETTELNNFRDVGGLAVTGGVVREGAVFRSDDVSTVPVEQADWLVAQGVRTIIDLRSVAEADHTGRGALGSHDVDYHRFPLVRGGASPDVFHAHLRDGTATPQVVGQYYADTLVAEASTIASGISLIAERGRGVLFHCAAGKDRTGIFAAGLLSVLGADDEVIATDYARSAVAIPRIMARVSASIGHLMGESDAYFRAVAEGSAEVSPLLGAEHDAMLAMLATLRAERGGAAEVLRVDGGLRDETVERLRAALVVPGGSGSVA